MVCYGDDVTHVLLVCAVMVMMYLYVQSQKLKWSSIAVVQVSCCGTHSLLQSRGQLMCAEKHSSSCVAWYNIYYGGRGDMLLLILWQRCDCPFWLGNEVCDA